VLVVDMTESFLAALRTDGDPLAATERLLATARDAGVPVFYARPPDVGTYPEGYPKPTKASPGSSRGPNPSEDRDAASDGESRTEFLDGLTTFPDEIAPREDETVLSKPKASAFFDTHLANCLHHHDVDTLVVAGLNTSGCVRATVVDSHSSNFRTIVPAECVGGTMPVSHEVALFDVDRSYADVTPLADVMVALRASGEGSETES
jgi:maleamate amidohydrolase